MLQPLPYHCRICHAPHVAYYDDECPGMRLEEWKKGLTCNSCHEYRAARICLEERIKHVCAWVQANKTEAAVNHCRLKLERLTVEYAELVCKRARLERVWEQDFVEQLLEHPDQPGAVLGAYRDGLRRLKAQAQ